MRPGIWLVVHNDRDEVYACLESAVDALGNITDGVSVARPLSPDEIENLHARGA